VLIKSARRRLERMEKVDTLVVDKTGHAGPRAKPSASFGSRFAAPGMSESHNPCSLRRAWSARGSEHPLRRRPSSRRRANRSLSLKDANGGLPRVNRQGA